MIQLALAVLAYVPTFLRSRHDLGLEILVLCQPLAVFKRRHPRPRLRRRDRLYWVAPRSLWDRWIAREYVACYSRAAFVHRFSTGIAEMR
jgi:hypothetical protein